MRFLTGVIIVLGMVVVLLGILFWCAFEENSRMWDRLKQRDVDLLTYSMSVVELETALEEQGWALDEAVQSFNDCLSANPDYYPYEFKLEDDGVWWRTSGGTWIYQGAIDNEY